MSRPLLINGGSLLLLLLTGFALGGVIDLTDQNFEHLTQASTGSTTGPWFVEFFAPWCGHCKALAPTWKKLSEELAESVNVAQVDVTSNSALAKRFRIKGFPTLIFMKNGFMTTYTGSRDIEALKAYTVSGFEKTMKQKIPPPPTFTSEMKQFITEAVRGASKVFTHIPGAACLILFSGAIIGGVAVILTGAIVGSGNHQRKNGGKSD